MAKDLVRLLILIMNKVQQLELENMSQKLSQVKANRCHRLAWHCSTPLSSFNLIFLLQILTGNINTYSEVEQILQPIIFATKIRIYPYSQYDRTVCLRTEIIGCPWEGKWILYQFIMIGLAYIQTNPFSFMAFSMIALAFKWLYVDPATDVEFLVNWGEVFFQSLMNIVQAWS